MDLYIREDVDRLLFQEEELLRLLSNKTIFITGATGLIGSHLVFTLLEANRKYNLAIRVLALVRSLEKAKDIFVEYVEDSSLCLICGDVLALPEIFEPIDYVVHGASVTSSQSFVSQPVDTINVAIQGTMNVLALAKYKQVNSFVYLSSLEVYGSVSKEDVSEMDIGYIDFLNVRSSYSESKRMVECLCSSYAKQFNLPIKIVRLSQTFGPGVDYRDNRVFAQFARSVIENVPIVLHTKGETKRNYCYTSDAVTGILVVLLKGEVVEAYNVANENTFISIMDMANLMLKVNPETQSTVVVDLKDAQSLGYNPTSKIRLMTSKLQELGWIPRVDMPEMLRRLVLSMKERRLDL